MTKLRVDISAGTYVFTEPVTVPLVSRAANLSLWGNEVKCFSLYCEF